MGSGGTSTQTIPRRNPEPEYLSNLRTQLLDKIMPGLESFSTDDWSRARDTANKALEQQAQLISQIPNTLNQSGSIANEIAELARTGNIPTGLADNLNASVNQELKSGMGTMLNSLANRGVLNSSSMTQGVNNLSKQAADAYTRNYLTAYQSALGGLESALQGQQRNTNAITTGVYTLGKIPEQAYEGAGAGLTTPYNFWKELQKSYDTREDYDTIVTQESGSCITGDTTIRLQDGKEIPVSELKDTDIIQAWDFDNGCTVSVPLTAFFRRSDDKGFDVIRVEFDDGSTVGVVKEHLFFDIGERKFVAVNADSQDYIGHEFAKAGHDGQILPVKVKRIHTDGKVTQTYAPQCEGHLNFLADGFITGNDGQLGLCNRYEFDAQAMKYDADKKKTDLEKYGLLDYEIVQGVVSKEFFVNNHIAEFSVSIGKGLVTGQYLKDYLAMYSHCFLN